jgi:transmembrane protein 222
MSRKSSPVADSPVQLPPVIDVQREHYPFCIVWAPIPLLSWVCPILGHIAICDSQGRIYDFQGSYRIGVDHMLFGVPVKYWDLSRDYVPSFYNPSQSDPVASDAAVRREIAAYDEGVANATAHFRQNEQYNFFTNNCHVFAAESLNRQQLKKHHMGMVRIAIGMALHGEYVSTARFWKAHMPFFILVTLIVLLVILL